MNIRKPIFTSLMSIAAIAPCKAQKSVEFISETGVMGAAKKEVSFYSGMNFDFIKNRNLTDLFVGASIAPDKKPSFIGIAINNFSWTKNLSSWIRETFVANKHTTTSTLEAAPIKANVSAGRFNFALSPAYTLNNDLKEGSTTQSINTIFQTSYSISPNDMIFAEAKYTSEPAKNLFSTHFGKLKDNISYYIAYMKKF
jgi:hypothetical protein